MRFGLIGYPLEHSLSPLVHAELGDYPYELRPLPEEEFDAFMRARDFEAVNVTLPYKQRVIPYCDRLTDRARACGSGLPARSSGCACEPRHNVRNPDTAPPKKHPRPGEGRRTRVAIDDEAAIRRRPTLRDVRRRRPRRRRRGQGVRRRAFR